MKRLFAAILASAVLATTAFADWNLSPKNKWIGSVWWQNGLTFWAPLDDPASPLKVNKSAAGTTALSFTRATSATYVHPTTGLITTAASGQLRIESNGALIEGQRTNVATYSDNIATWIGPTHATTILDNAIGPDGLLTADYLMEDNTATTEHYISGQALTMDDNVTYTVSLYVKPNGRTSVLLDCFSKVPTEYYSYFTLTGSGTATGSGIISLGPNGYYRIAESFSSGAGAATPRCNVFLNNGSITYTGDGVSGVWIAGLQAEIGSFPSSYIPTVAAAVTRNADSLTFPTASNVSGTVGTAYVTADLNYAIPFTHQPMLSAASSRILYKHPTADKISNYDGTNLLSGVSLSASTTYKLASAWGGSSKSLVADGGTVYSGAFDGDMSLTTNLNIGTNMFGHIKNLRIWNRAFTDAELQSITQ